MEQGKCDNLFLRSNRSQYENYITESSQKKYFSLDKLFRKFLCCARHDFREVKTRE